MKKRTKKKLKSSTAIFTEDKDLHFNLKRDYVPSLDFIKALKDADIEAIYLYPHKEPTVYETANKTPISSQFIFLKKSNYTQKEFTAEFIRTFQETYTSVEFTDKITEQLSILEVFLYARMLWVYEDEDISMSKIACFHAADIRVFACDIDLEQLENYPLYEVEI